MDTQELDLTKLSKEELYDLELTAIAELDKFDAEIKNRSYKLPDVDGSRKTIGKSINLLLDKVECQWEYTLGILGLMEFWKGSRKTITYGEVDSTLRLLGGLKFQGHKELAAVVDVNEYFGSIREEYKADLEVYMELSEKHMAIQKAIDEIAQLETPIMITEELN